MDSVRASVSAEDSACLEPNDIQVTVHYRTSLSLSLFYRISLVDVQVGWACPGCSNVFQQESMLLAHQKTVCTSVNGSFGLIQTHYRCRSCENDCGSQVRKRRRKKRDID